MKQLLFLLTFVLCASSSLSCKPPVKKNPTPTPTPTATPPATDPSGSQCPPEASRGWAILYVKRGKEIICGDPKACGRMPYFLVGDRLMLDSTPRTNDCRHYPDGRKLCEFPQGCSGTPTDWTIPDSFDVRDAGDDYSLELIALRSGTYQIKACPPPEGPGTCTEKSIVIQ